jgi:NADH:ubiquinone oxidoreductase subunit 3 (chain A)
MNNLYLTEDYLPVLIQILVSVGFVVFVMIITHLITRKQIRTSRKEENFECGIEIHGNARFPFSVKYFLVAILFVLFDVELVFFYPWAVNFKDTDWSGFLYMMLFLAVFLFGFYYIYRKGAFNWNEDKD